jgi:hypothetical protein
MVSIRENMHWWCGAGDRSVLDIGGIMNVGRKLRFLEKS